MQPEVFAGRETDCLCLSGHIKHREHRLDWQLTPNPLMLHWPIRHKKSVSGCVSCFWYHQDPFAGLFSDWSCCNLSALSTWQQFSL